MSDVRPLFRALISCDVKYTNQIVQNIPCDVKYTNQIVQNIPCDVKYTNQIVNLMCKIFTFLSFLISSFIGFLVLPNKSIKLSRYSSIIYIDVLKENLVLKT